MVLFCWKKIGSAHRVIGGLVLFTLVMEALGWCYSLYGKNNLFLFSIFTWVEGILLIIYYYLLTRSSGYKFLFLVWGLIFIVLSIISLLYGESFDHYNSFQRSAGSIWSSLLCLFFFLYIFQKENIQNLLVYSHYWMTSGFLLYFAGMLFLNLLADYIVTNKILTFNPFFIHSILNIFLNFIYTIVLWLGRREAILRKY